MGFVTTFFLAALVAVGVNYISYLIAPKPPTAEREETQDLEAPEADPSMPLPVVFGTMRVKGLNTLGYANLSKREYEVDA